MLYLVLKAAISGVLIARLDPASLAERIFEALRGDGYGQWRELVPVLVHGLGQLGLERKRCSQAT